MKGNARTAFCLLLIFLAALSGFATGQGERREAGKAAEEAAPPMDERGAAEADKESLPPGFPIVEEPIVLHGFGRRDVAHGPWDRMLLWQEMERISNIHVEWETPGPSMVMERLRYLLSTGELPDFLIKSGIDPVDIVKYGPTGSFISLEDLIEGHAPHLNALLAEHPQWRKAITAPDGHIYYLPGIVDYPGIMTFRFPMLNTAWLRKSGSSVPATTEELAQVLRSFRDRDMNGNGDPADEIPYSAHTMDYALRAFLGSFGLDYQCRYWISIQEEEPEITLTDPRFRELLRYFNLLYTEKLLDPEILTQNTELYLGKLRDGRIGFTPLYDRLEAGSYAGQYEVIEPLAGPSGERGWRGMTKSAIGGKPAFVVTSANPYPAETVRWIDTFYSYQGSVLLYLGVEGVTFEKKPDGSLDYLPRIYADQRGITRAQGDFTITPYGGEPGYYGDNPHWFPQTEVPRYYQVVKDFLPGYVYNQPMFDQADQERFSALHSLVDAYWREMRAKFVTGEASLDLWSEYVRRMEKLGLRELEALYRDALE